MDGIPFQQDFTDSGWLRWLPEVSWTLNMLVSCLTLDEAPGSPWDQPSGSRAAAVLSRLDRDASAWAVEDDELTRAESPSEFEFDRNRRARITGALEPFGFGPGSSTGDVLELMRTFGLVTVEVDDDGVEAWRVVDPLPLPEERLRLSSEERAEEARHRLDDMYGPLQSSLAGLLSNDPADTVRTSLARLGERLNADPDDAREALLLVLESRSFTANRDVSRLRADQVFEITIDRAVFQEEYLEVELTTPED